MSPKNWPRVAQKIIVIVACTIVFLTYYLFNGTYPKSYNKDSFVETMNPELAYDFDQPSFNNPLNYKFDGEILVHLDLKGAPPKISYIKKIFTLISNLGATGVLLEYEDMFPYEGDIEDIKALNAYSSEDIEVIVQEAKINNLMIIPLVQTFGHLEYVLKLEKYQKFRELDEAPDIICPSENQSHEVLHAMIDQILKVHTQAKYLHIGCDEVDVLGFCEKCQHTIKNNKWRKMDIYFNHIKKIAEYLKEKHPQVRPIIWGDKIYKKLEKVLIEHEIPELVDVMFWNYKSEEESFPLQADLDSFAKTFKRIWIAGAFKGTTKINQIITNPQPHLKNNEGWMKVFLKWKDKIRFKGIALTGWQRYNHFAVLCDLLPIGLVSLAINLQFIKNLKDVDYFGIRNSLKCNQDFPVTLSEVSTLKELTELKCDFPGFNAFRIINVYAKKLKEVENYLWYLQSCHFSLYNTAFNFTHPRNILALGKDKILTSHLNSVNELENEIKSALSEIYDEHTVSEWINTYVLPLQLRLTAASKIVQGMFEQRTWPRRPLKINDSWRNLFDKICGPTERKGCELFQLYSYERYFEN